MTLDSSHPLIPPITNFALNDLLLYTHECNIGEIAYFKVDINLIEKLPFATLGLIWNANSSHHDSFWMQCDLSRILREKFAFKSIGAILGMIDNNVESVKIVGTRDMNMDSKTKTIFDEIDYTNQNFLNKFTKPYFNDVQENFIFDPFERSRTLHYRHKCIKNGSKLK